MTLEVWLGVAAVVLVLIAAVLAVAETAMTQVTRARASAMAEQGRRGADRVQRIVDNIERDLNGDGDGIAGNEAANSAVAPCRALYKSAQRCGATHAQENGAAQSKERIHA